MVMDTQGSPDATECKAVGWVERLRDPTPPALLNVGSREELDPTYRLPTVHAEKVAR